VSEERKARTKDRPQDLTGEGVTPIRRTALAALIDFAYETFSPGELVYLAGGLEDAANRKRKESKA
jgi:hypothetical protein